MISSRPRASLEISQENKNDMLFSNESIEIERLETEMEMVDHAFSLMQETRQKLQKLLHDCSID